MRKHAVATALFVSALACGGLDDSKKLSELSADERKSLCEEGYAAQGSSTASKDCGMGVTLTPDSVEQCTTGMSASTCTVGQVRSCYGSLGGDACKLLSTPECAAVISCGTGGG